MSNPIKKVSLIITHNKRLQCLLRNFIGSKPVRFMNCAIIRMSIKLEELSNNTNKNYKVSMELVYNGEIGKDEKKPKYVYYVNYVNSVSNVPYSDYGFLDENDNNNSKIVQKGKYIEEVFPIITDKLYNAVELHEALGHKIIPTENIFSKGYEYIYYLTRHGQAAHNLIEGVHKLKKLVNGPRDTMLTPTGEEQAKNAGEQLKTILQTYNDTPEYFFVSDLKRTHYTLLNIYSEMHAGNDVSTHNPLTAYVLPCSHEIGDCHAEPSTLTPENITCYTSSHADCSTKSTTPTSFQTLYMTQISTGTGSTGSILNINWQEYIEFYKDYQQDMLKRKNGVYFIGKTSICSQITMLENVTNIINKFPVY